MIIRHEASPGDRAAVIAPDRRSRVREVCLTICFDMLDAGRTRTREQESPSAPSVAARRSGVRSFLTATTSFPSSYTARTGRFFYFSFTFST